MCIKSIIMQGIYQANYFIPYGVYAKITRTIQELQPDKPEDGTTGFLAYNVPNKNRMKMKTGRFLTRKLNLNSGFLPDTVIQKLASNINTHLFPDLGIRLDKGKAITENYKNGVGGHSCMTGNCAEYTKLYEANPDRFQQLVMIQNGDSARAIVHKLDDGTYMLDRIYGTCEYLKGKMRDYAVKQGWPIRGKGGTVSGLNYTDGEIPYMDTMIYYKIVNGLLTIGTCLSSYDGVLSNTDGEFCSGILCECCEEYYDEDHMTLIGDCDYCESCVSRDFTYCESCCEYCVNDDAIEITDINQYVCKYCAGNEYSYCESCDEYVSETQTLDGNTEVCNNCSEEHYHCYSCGDLVSETENGYCEDCIPEEEEVNAT
jgi:hypothetical protein